MSELVFHDDGTINMGIKMWDIHAIRRWKQEIAKAMTRTCGTSYETRPYMMHLPKKDREIYRIEDLGDLEGTKYINLKDHVGLWRSDAPAFGAPLINYEE